MIYRFRIVLDTLEDVFRDIEISADSSLEDLHNAIVQAFNFEGSEMASFYKSDENWNQGEEIALFDMSDGLDQVKIMSDTNINSMVSSEDTKLIYVYDFLNMWTFYVELADIVPIEVGITYPHLMYSHGIMPETPPDKEFTGEDLNDDDFSNDEFEEFGDNYIDLDNIDDIDLDQWN